MASERLIGPQRQWGCWQDLLEPRLDSGSGDVDDDVALLVPGVDEPVGFLDAFQGEAAVDDDLERVVLDELGHERERFVFVCGQAAHESLATREWCPEPVEDTVD